MTDSTLLCAMLLYCTVRLFRLGCGIEHTVMIGNISKDRLIFVPINFEAGERLQIALANAVDNAETVWISPIIST
uniref:Uncharacterized protein n=1 Tax=Oryza rufipogon TaxID=4529 RepID=A0A0E0P588_ORYRU